MGKKWHERNFFHIKSWFLYDFVLFTGKCVKTFCVTRNREKREPAGQRTSQWTSTVTLFTEGCHPKSFSVIHVPWSSLSSSSFPLLPFLSILFSPCRFSWYTSDSKRICRNRLLSHTLSFSVCHDWRRNIYYYLSRQTSYRWTDMLLRRPIHDSTGGFEGDKNEEDTRSIVMSEERRWEADHLFSEQISFDRLLWSSCLPDSLDSSYIFFMNKKIVRWSSRSFKQQSKECRENQRKGSENQDKVSRCSSLVFSLSHPLPFSDSWTTTFQ